jgi:hypothetical protein
VCALLAFHGRVVERHGERWRGFTGVLLVRRETDAQMESGPRSEAWPARRHSDSHLRRRRTTAGNRMNKPFVGFVDDAGKLTLDFPEAFKAFYQRFKGHVVEVTIAKQGALKTRLQEKGFHAMISPWANEAGININDLKTDLLGEILGWSETPSPLTGRLLPLQQHTSKLSRTDYSKLIEQTMVIAAHYGYVLEAPNEYRERKEKEAKKRQRAA